MASTRILTRNRWCPRCEDYTVQTRDLERWRVEGPLWIVGSLVTFFESGMATWFCEGCRRSVRPFQRPSTPVEVDEDEVEEEGEDEDEEEDAPSSKA